MGSTKNVISLFSGALGLDLGLEKAGFILKAAVERNQFALQTIKDNQKHLEHKKPVIIDRPLSLKNVGDICSSF